MSDEREPDEQAYDDPTHDETAPTQPLAGWRDPASRVEEPESAVQPDGLPYGHDEAVLAGPPPSADGPSDRLPTAAPGESAEQRPHEPDTPTVPMRQGPGPWSGHGQAPYGQAPYGQAPYGQAPYGQAPYGQAPYGQNHYGQNPYSQSSHARSPYARNPSTRRLPLWVWPAVACLALVVGILGGLAGGALQDELASQRGTNDNGLGGVRTQAAAPLEADNGSVSAVAQALLPSTVQILAELDGRAAGATGSGFVLDRDGHVVTNNHVVASAAADDGSIVVIDQAGERREATVLGRSAVYDLAVLTVEDAGSLEPAALGASQALRVGESVVAFGAPLGLSQTVTSGIVSALNRPVTTSGESDDESSYINAVQTDAAINPGNSGGPLVNLAGEVVGVNSAIATTGGASGESGNIGVGFAIPIEQVRTTVDQILRTGKAEYPVIGAQVRTGGEPDAEGATITEVMPDTPAERAGLQQDDVITSVDDQPVNDGIALIVAIRTHLPGETVEMSVVRGGEERVVQVELDGKVG
ncbi:trypsin-like peptidase domain-containing protein [Mycobacterium cookii]